MSTAMKCQLVVLCGLLTGAAGGQLVQSEPNKASYARDPANLPDAIAKVKSGDFSTGHVEMIAMAGAVQAIPILEVQYSRANDSLNKGELASALVRLGDKDNTYWDFLVENATSGLQTDAPPPLRRDSQPRPSQDFIDWAKAHNTTTDEALSSLYNSALALSFVAKSGDPRALPLLRRGLSSPYFITQAFAAEGLARLQDKESIPLIIDACKKALPAGAAAIAKSLVYFDEPEAQRAVDTYIPKNMARLYREARANGKTL